MSMPRPTLSELIANATFLAQTLDIEKRPQSAKLVRDLIGRLAPGKVIAAAKPRQHRAPEPIVQAKPGTWCKQCEQLVGAREARDCSSKFCGVKA